MRNLNGATTYNINNKMKDYVIYTGFYYTIEWYLDGKGKSQALSYFLELACKEQVQFLTLAKFIGDFGKIFNDAKFNYEGNKIYAFNLPSNRFLCFFYRGEKIIITNAFYNKGQKLPIKEKELALECMKSYIESTGKIEILNEQYIFKVNER
ncbi:type II toxin-antitoxin system RelE/ParE family toxin [Candidatus Jidaibacter acanthamoebae]|nr:type II toxin-antitoxin system RelE/ParE family toxin [Candidatus Jidaibacter acanthamoeba]